MTAPVERLSRDPVCELIDLLVGAMARFGDRSWRTATYSNLTDTGQMLLQEIDETVAPYRYQDLPPHELNPVEVLEAVARYRYQHAAWDGSEAERFCGLLVEVVVDHPGYVNAVTVDRDQLG